MLLDETALVANAIYIYLILVFGSVVLGSTLVIIRGFVNRGRSNPAHIEEHIVVIETDPVSGSRVKVQIKPATVESQKRTVQATDSKGVLCCRGGRGEAEAIIDQQKKDECGQEVASSSTAEVEQQDTISVRSIPVRPQVPHMYSLETLMAMNKDVTQASFEPDAVRLSVLLAPSIDVPYSREASRFTMDRDLEFSEVLLEQPLLEHKCVGLFKLVSAASFNKPYSNLQHFHVGFIRTITSLVDSLDMLFVSSKIPSLQLALIDLTLVFLWEHWNWEEGLRLVSAEKLTRNIVVSAGDTAGSVTVQTALGKDRFEPDQPSKLPSRDLVKLYDPEVLSDEDIFRLFCNLYLGTPLMAKAVRNRCVFKLSAVFHCCASRTKCHRHVDLSGILLQALSSTARDSQRAFFYDVLMKVLQPHIHCCLRPEDVFANTSVIQKLIFQGLWTDQPVSVRDKAVSVVTMLSDRFQDIISWNRSMKFTHLSDDRGMGRSGAPGAWSSFS